MEGNNNTPGSSRYRAILLLVALLLVGIIVVFFCMGLNQNNTSKVIDEFHQPVIFVAESQENNITITNLGGVEWDEVSKIYISFNNRPFSDVTQKLHMVGYTLTHPREGGNERVQIKIDFNDNTTLLVYDKIV
jgi:hypothetical protein